MPGPGDPIEGDPFGADKIAHALFVLAITGWGEILFPGEGATFLVIATILGCGLELSNRWKVLKGIRGISILDFLGYLAGGVLSAGLLWFGL